MVGAIGQAATTTRAARPRAVLPGRTRKPAARTVSSKALRLPRWCQPFSLMQERAKLIACPFTGCWSTM
jgi:hypothetical protein